MKHQFNNFSCSLLHDQAPLFLSFLSVLLFENFKFEIDGIYLKTNPRMDKELISLYLALLRKTTGKEFYFEVLIDPNSLKLKCLSDNNYFSKIRKGIKLDTDNTINKNNRIKSLKDNVQSKKNKI